MSNQNKNNILWIISDMESLAFDKIQFFFFGCWNRNSCKYNPALKKVVKNITANKKLYDFGVILGDNVYPNYLNHYYIDILKNGIECINSIGVPMYAVLGNHDIVQCDIISTVSKTNKNWIFNKNFYAITHSRNNISVRLIIIDTNLLSDENVYHKKQDCKLPDNINTNYGDMIKFLKIELGQSKQYNWVIVAGHSPIASFKQKENIMKPYANTKIDLMLELFGSVPNLVYICADTHNFQYSTINVKGTDITVKQVISGTGGAAPARILPVFKDEKFHDIDEKNQIMMHDTYSPFGYSDMIVMEKKIVIIYHQIDPEFQEHIFELEQTDNDIKDQPGTETNNQEGGHKLFFKKYIKYKTKYIKKLNSINSDDISS